MNSLKAIIKQQKPNIKAITLNNYVRNIKIIISKYTNLDITTFSPIYLKSFEDVEKFILFLSNLKVAEATKYTYLFAVITLLSLDNYLKQKMKKNDGRLCLVLLKRLMNLEKIFQHLKNIETL